MRTELFDPRIPADPQIGYVFCDLCGSAFPSDEIKLFIFSDEEELNICNYCPIDDCGEVEGIYAIDEADYYEPIEKFYADERD